MDEYRFGYRDPKHSNLIFAERYRDTEIFESLSCWQPVELVDP